VLHEEFMPIIHANSCDSDVIGVHIDVSIVVPLQHRSSDINISTEVSGGRPGETLSSLVVAALVGRSICSVIAGN